MDKKNSSSPVKNSEVTLEKLFEEVAMLETATKKVEKEKTPRWLSEESVRRC